jgi:predicted alpha/beta hydrolase
MPVERIKIIAKDGYPLAATLRTPAADPRGVVQINCGTGIPQKLYSHLAAFLSENGYVTITYDYRGISESKPANLRGFKADLLDWAALDMAAVFDWILEHHPSQPKIFISHSMGGQLVGLLQSNHCIDALFLIASSTGYWYDMSSPYKWLMPPLWFLFIPITTSIYGFANAGLIGQGEDLPKGVALRWQKWCIDPRYFERDFERSKIPVYFDQVKVPVKSIQIADDPIANGTTSDKLLAYYTKARVSVERVSPSELGVDRIGHAGYFSRRFKDTLWRNLLRDIDRVVSEK